MQEKKKNKKNKTPTKKKKKQQKDNTNKKHEIYTRWDRKTGNFIWWGNGVSLHACSGVENGRLTSEERKKKLTEGQEKGGKTYLQ